MYNYITPIGSFSDGNSYRDALIAKGYTDMGWMNGWGKEKDQEWDNLRKDQKVESFQWNRSGSDCTYVIHSLKVFSSVDMGD